MKFFITTDWAPHIEAAVRSIAAIAAFVYTAGYCTGQWLHNLNDSTTALLVPKPQPAPAPAPVPVQRPIVQRFAIAAVPAYSGIMPRDPMDRAVAKVRSGMSQRKAAALCGVSRSSLQRALKG
jgi:hypothetical protein